jgi:hypothetical protein
MPPELPKPEPRWPALVGTLAIGGVFLALPEPLTFGPNWLLLSVTAPLGAGAMIAYRAGRHGVNKLIGYGLLTIVTVALTSSLGALIAGLPSHREPAVVLLRAATALWISNILVFASWYWRLDAGGPHARDVRGKHVDGAFLFPQMTARTDRHWAPGFVDYLHLAFNTSTAFSPTDVAPLTRWAKMLMMVQSLISLGCIVILGARAVNVL